MAFYRHLRNAIEHSERHQTCITAGAAGSRTTMRRHYRTQEFVEPYRGLYARTQYWQGLWHQEKIRHIARTLVKKLTYRHCVFTGETAAALLGLSTINMPDERQPIIIHIISKSTNKFTQNKQLSRITIPDIPYETTNAFQKNSYNIYSQDMHSFTQDTILSSHITSVCLTLFVCAWTLPFRFALPIFDSAAKLGIRLDEVYRYCQETYRKFHYQLSACNIHDIPYLQTRTSPYFTNLNKYDALGRLRLLCTLADRRSANAGESMARAVMLELGFMKPVLQYTINNEANTKWPYRCDYAWKTNNQIIVGEFDGLAKYTSLTHQHHTITRTNINRSNNTRTAKNQEKRGVITNLLNTTLPKSIGIITTASELINTSNINDINHVHFDHASVKRERDRERYLYNHGVSNIARFDFIDVVRPQRLERILTNAGVPRIQYT